MNTQGYFFLFAAIQAIGAIFPVFAFFGITPKSFAGRWHMPSEHRWILWLAIFLFVGTLVSSGMGWYITFQPKDSEKDLSNAVLEEIRDHVFRNEIVTIDGKSFSHCEFINITFKYNGGPARLVNNTFSESIIFRTDNRKIDATLILLRELHMLNPTTNIFGAHGENIKTIP